MQHRSIDHRHKTMRATRWALMPVVVAALTLAAACATGEEVPTLERRAQEINEAVMCPVCPGESIDQSQHVLAVQMRAIVDEKLEAGSTEQEIKGFFVARYGPSVLLEPPRRGFDLLVWLVPPVGLGLAAIALYLALRSMARPRDRHAEAVNGTSGLTEEERSVYLSRAESALALEGEPRDVADEPSDDRPGGGS